MHSSKLRLRARLMALGLVAAVPALVVITYTQALERARVRDGVVAGLQQLARVSASEQTVVFDGVQRLLLTLSKFPSMRTISAAECQALLPGVLHDHPGYVNIWVTLSDGTPFCEATPNAATAASNRSRSWFTRAVSNRAVVASDIQTSVVSGKPDIVLAQPLLSASGSVDRIIAASVGLEMLTGVAAQAQLPAGASLTLFDRSQRIVACLPDAGGSLGTIVPPEMRSPGGAADGSVRDIVGTDGRPKLYTTARVGSGLDTGLVLGISLDRDSAYAPADTLLEHQALLLLLVFLACVTAAVVGGEWFVTRPISAMADVTRRLAAGDLSARARLRRSVPGLTDLAMAVNSMASEFETREAERQLAEAALQASETQRIHLQKLEAIGQLAAGIAHNFNNLLTVIVGFSQLLLVRHAEGSADRADLLEIDQAARRGAELTRQLLTFSRKHEAVPQTLDLNQAITGMRAMLDRALREDITLTIEPSTGPALVHIDPQEIEQVLLNLALNARDAQPHGGTIRISSAVVVVGARPGPAEIQAPPGEYVRLRVSDSGVGMPREVLAHLFEPFFTTKDVGQGTGLGLAAVDGIVRHNHGVVTVESRVGAGSVFSVYLPVAPSDAVIAARPATAAPAATRATATILVVEDEAPVRAIVVRTLERAGYTVLSAGMPSLAWDIFDQRAEDIALVVSDIVMPEMHGTELVERLVVRKPGVRVLFISGYSDDALASQLHGAQLLRKPFAPSALIAAVADRLR